MSESRAVAEGDRERTSEAVSSQGDGPQRPALLEERVRDPAREVVPAEVEELEGAEFGELRVQGSGEVVVGED